MSKKNKLDQYYTNNWLAKKCSKIFKDTIPEENREVVLEPSAGNGAFLGFFDKMVAIDIDPKHNDVQRADFLESTRHSLGIPHKDRVSIVGNPPFGFAASLAIRFFNHATTIANSIGFILPKTFQKASVQEKLNVHYHPVQEYEVPKNSFILHGRKYNVPCVFQIWTYQQEARKIDSVETSDFIFVKKSASTDRTFCLRRAGGKAGQVLDGLDHADVSTYFIEPQVPGVKEQLKSIDFSSIVDRTAGVKSLSKKEIILEYNKK